MEHFPEVRSVKFLLLNFLHLTLRYTGGGHDDHPQQLKLLSLTAPTGRFGLVQSSYEFGHMGTQYVPDQKNV